MRMWDLEPGFQAVALTFGVMRAEMMWAGITVCHLVFLNYKVPGLAPTSPAYLVPSLAACRWNTLVTRTQLCSTPGTLRQAERDGLQQVTIQSCGSRVIRLGFVDSLSGCTMDCG